MSPYFSCITSKVVIRMLSNNFSRNDSKLFFFCSKKNEFDASWKHGIKKKKMKINFDIFHVSTRLFFFFNLMASSTTRRKNKRRRKISKNDNWRYDYKVNGFRRTRERCVNEKLISISFTIYPLQLIKFLSKFRLKKNIYIDNF